MNQSSALKADLPVADAGTLMTHLGLHVDQLEVSLLNKGNIKVRQ